MKNNPIKLDPNTFRTLTQDLAMIQTLPARSPAKTVEMRQVIATLKRFNFIEFHANNGSLLYPSQVGKYTERYIPKGKRGHLRPFQGQRVTVVCTGSGLNRTRQYMAGPV